MRLDIDNEKYKAEGEELKKNAIDIKEYKKQMSGKEKWQYFWEYYKWFVIVPIIVVFLFIYLIHSFINESRPSDLFIALVNCRDEESIKGYLNSYADELMADGVISDGLRIEGGLMLPNPEDVGEAPDNLAVASSERYQVDVFSERVDASIVSDWVAEEYSMAGGYMDLTNLLTDEEKENWKDDLLYTDAGEGKTIITGVYLDADIFIENFKGEKPVYAISYFVADPEMAMTFLRHCKN